MKCYNGLQCVSRKYKECDQGNNLKVAQETFFTKGKWKTVIKCCNEIQCVTRL